MYEFFRDLYYGKGDTEVIIVGFSRGAAEARAFANRIYDEATARGEPVPQIQFVGLFDTVRMTPGLEQAIPPNVAYVAHATARNERRRAFPLTELYLRDPGSSVTRMEREFYGAHSDLGGGYKDNWISNAALLWMWAQMRRAGVTTVNRPGATVTADLSRYLDYEQTVFPWHEALDRSGLGHAQPTPWHDSSTWWPWFLDRAFPLSQRHAIVD